MKKKKGNNSYITRDRVQYFMRYLLCVSSREKRTCIITGNACKYF